MNDKEKILRKVTFTQKYALVRIPRQWLETQYVTIQKLDTTIVIKPVSKT